MRVGHTPLHQRILISFVLLYTTRYTQFKGIMAINIPNLLSMVSILHGPSHFLDDLFDAFLESSFTINFPWEFFFGSPKGHPNCNYFCLIRLSNAR